MLIALLAVLGVNLRGEVLLGPYREPAYATVAVRGRV